MERPFYINQSRVKQVITGHMAVNKVYRDLVQFFSFFFHCVYAFKKIAKKGIERKGK